MTDKEKIKIMVKALQAIHYEESYCFYTVYRALKITGNLDPQRKIKYQDYLSSRSQRNNQKFEN